MIPKPEALNRTAQTIRAWATERRIQRLGRDKRIGLPEKEQLDRWAAILDSRGMGKSDGVFAVMDGAYNSAERGREWRNWAFNPVLTIPEDTLVEFFEGCLSLAGYTAIVPHATKVHVEGLNEHAEPARIDAAGWHARILQHEIDHLNGVLYIDRMNPRSFATLDNHQRIWKNKSITEVKWALSGELA